MNLSPKDIAVFIDRPYTGFGNNEAFNPASELNRDGQFSSGILLKERLHEKGFSINTADYLLDGRMSAKINIYVSFGVIVNYRQLSLREDVLLQSYYLDEPPVVDQKSYNDIENLTRCFEKVYIHNNKGVGYEKYFHNQQNIHKLYMAQIRNEVFEQLWSNQDRDFLVMISANKIKTPYLQLNSRQKPPGLRISLNQNPGLQYNELYSERIRALIALHDLGSIDLYGYNWDISLREILRNLPSSPLSFPFLYWRHRKCIKEIYRGTVKSKHE
ncbi:hypothetical protein ACFLUG_04935, partial [Chloroflexota bacterium]